MKLHRRWACRGAVGVSLWSASCAHREPVEEPPAPSTVMDAGAQDAARDVRLEAGVDAGSGRADDVARRILEVRERFGQAIRVRTVAGTFVLAETGPPGPLFTPAVALLERALPPFYDGRFTTHPDAAVTVLFFQTPASYQTYAARTFPDAGATLGIFRHGPREIDVDLANGEAYLPTLTHEVVHVLTEADFPEAPHWFSEGLATLFEAPVFGRDGSIHGQERNLRDDELREALATPNGRAELQLEALFAMSKTTFEAKSERSLHYAFARSFFAWLDAKGWLWPFYRAWRDGYTTDPRGTKAFASVTGGTPKERSGEWVTWAR